METRKIAAILVADVVGYAGSRERTRRELSPGSGRCAATSSTQQSPPATAASSSAPATAHRRIPQRGRAVRCAIEVQSGMVERNADVSPDHRIEFRVGIHLGDVVEESDGDLMGDGVNIAAA